MPSTAPLLTGWNLLFIVPFALGAILALLSVLAAGGGHGHGGHAGHSHLGHGHLGHGHGVGHHGGHAHTAQTHGHHTSHHHGHQTGDHRHEVKVGEKTHSAERVVEAPRGAVPPLIVIQNFLLFGGLCGLIANLIRGITPGDSPIPSVLVALLGGVLLTMMTSALLIRLLPVGTTSVSTAFDLEGRVGEADTTITTTGGSAYVRDWNGTLHHVACRLRVQSVEDGNADMNQGEDRLPGGTPVLLVEFNANGSYYEVRRWGEEKSNELV